MVSLSFRPHFLPVRWEYVIQISHVYSNFKYQNRRHPFECQSHRVYRSQDICNKKLETLCNLIELRRFNGNLTPVSWYHIQSPSMIKQYCFAQSKGYPTKTLSREIETNSLRAQYQRGATIWALFTGLPSTSTVPPSKLRHGYNKHRTLN